MQHNVLNISILAIKKIKYSSAKLNNSINTVELISFLSTEEKQCQTISIH